MNRVFYDIESLSNLFTIAFWAPDDTPAHLDVYLLAQRDDLIRHLGPDFRQRVTDEVMERNPVLKTLPNAPQVRIFDLHDPSVVMQLVRLIGIGIPLTRSDIERKARSVVCLYDPRCRVSDPSAYYRQTEFSFDVDADRKDRDTYLFGYNSYNYDTTMLAFYLASVTGAHFKQDESATTDVAYAYTPAVLHAIHKDVDTELLADPARLAREIDALTEKRDDTSPQDSERMRELNQRIRTLTAAQRALAAQASDNQMPVCGLIIDTADVDAQTLRTFNDILFTTKFVGQMSQALCYTLPELRQLTLALRPSKRVKEPKADFSTLPNLIRKFWLKSGRHLDVARLNEKQGRVGLKRQLGVIGRQIFEDAEVAQDAPIDESADAIARLIAYNASDVINLQYLFEDGNYQAPFDNKAMILDEYPETVYIDKDDPTTRVDPDATRSFADVEWAHANVRGDRLRIDSTSQQIISTVLCPNKRHPLEDGPTPCLDYPDQTAAAEAGLTIGRTNVLDDTMAFLRTQILDHLNPASDTYREAAAEFDAVERHYRAICEENFNSGSAYVNRYGEDAGVAQAPGIGTCVRYYDAKRQPTSCYAIVSEGGIHGAEYNKALYDADMRAYRTAKAILDEAKGLYCRPEDEDETTGALRLINEGVKTIAKGPILDPETGEPHIFSDGHTHLAKQVLTLSSTKKKAAWRELERPCLFRPVKIQSDIKRAFCDATGITVTELNPRYAYTSAVHANHEDFSSYYPSLLRMMRVFYNPDLGYDRYGTLYEQKQEFGTYQKDPSRALERVSPELRERLSHMDEDEQRRYWKRRRDGVKLMLNAGSGAGDAKFDNPIRMNNNTISMRMIGQLFTWRVGQAQALRGASVPSTNTDGLYTVMDAATNNEILAHEAETIGVRIDPEELMLISKDSNNRVEFADAGIADPAHATQREQLIDRYRILSAGGSLSCWRGPSSAKSIDHPAIYDWGCAFYLMNTMTYATCRMPDATADEAVRHAFELPFDEGLMRSLIALKLEEATADDAHQLAVLRLFQTMVVSSPSSISYVTARSVDESVRDEHLVQHYNRVFYVTRDAKMLAAAHVTPQYLRRVAGRKVSDATIASRKRRELFADDANAPYLDFQSAPEAAAMLASIGYDKLALAREQREPAFNKISGIDDDQYCHIANQDLYCMTSEERARLIDALDIDAYIRRIGEIYENNWRNAPGVSDLFQATLTPADTPVDEPCQD